MSTQSLALYYSIFYMHSNVWNLRANKERLGIMERTEAQKKHLINILCAKSKIDNHNQFKMKHSPSAPTNILQKKLIEKNNHSMIRRIMRINQVRHSPTRNENELSEVVRNLKTYSSLNRSIRMKEI